MQRNKRLIAVNSRRKRFVLLVLAISIVIFGLLAASLVQLRFQEYQKQEFQMSVDTAVDNVISQLNDYNDLLYIGRGLLQNSDAVNQADWAGFFKEQDVLERYSGISSVVYFKHLDRNEKNDFLQHMRGLPMYSQDLTIRPVGDRDRYAVASLVYSANDVSKIFGQDLYSIDSRKIVLDKAAALRKPTASPPVELLSGHGGFIIALPNYVDKNLDGFVVTSFRNNDLFEAILPQNHSKFLYQIDDVSDTEAKNLYRSEGYTTDNRQLATSRATIGTKTWRITVASAEPRSQYIVANLYPVVILTSAVLLAITLVLAVNYVTVRRSKL
jgi:CHASE1-domain containing sensor protein